MYDPSKILTWMEENVQMRQSRRKSPAGIVAGAMRMRDSGVLALGRAMNGPARDKHRMKRADRFLGNAQVEVPAISESFVIYWVRNRADCDLADWTARHAFQQLVLATDLEGNSARQSVDLYTKRMRIEAALRCRRRVAGKG